MAYIIVYIHEYDVFTKINWGPPPRLAGAWLFKVLKELERLGHRWRLVRGPKRVSGDAAFMHVDGTYVPEDYAALAGNFEHAFNFGALDLSKRRVSGAVLSRDAEWQGRVIVKSNLNYHGYVEAGHNSRARRADAPAPHPDIQIWPRYVILDHPSEVPETLWQDPNLVVERFVPELAPEGGYVVRIWKFLRDTEVCLRLVARDPVVKARNTVSMSHVPVPAALRAQRARLALDYGKLDFVEYRGEAILLDANRTPGTPAWSFGRLPREFAGSLDRLFRAASESDAPAVLPGLLARDTAAPDALNT